MVTYLMGKCVRPLTQTVTNVISKINYKHNIYVPQFIYVVY